jgi:hypothetical protein
MPTRCSAALLLVASTAWADPPGRWLEYPRGTVEVDVAVANDNRLFGLWRLLSGRDGDDFGYTHGTALGVGTVVHGIHLRVEASTDLYTRRLGVRANTEDDRGVFTEQAFTNHDRFGVVARWEPPWEGLTWRGRTGWEQLDSVHAGNPLQAAGQQQLFHDLVNAIDPLQATNPGFVPDGLGVRHGWWASGALGFRKAWGVRSDLAVRLDAEVGLDLATLDFGTALTSDAEVSMWWQRHGEAPAVQLALGLSTQLRPDGAEVRPRGRLVVGHRVAALFVDVTAPLGALSPFARYHDTHRKTGLPDVWTVVGLRFAGRPGRPHRRQGVP